MAKYIQFPAVLDSESIIPTIGNQVFNTDTITLVTTNGSSGLSIYCGLINYDYRVSNTAAAKWVDAINEAILEVPGPTLTNVIVPGDSYISEFSVSNISAV